MNKLAIIFLCITVGLGSFILGYSSKQIAMGSNNSTSIQDRLASLKEGETLTISESELATIQDEKIYDGATSEKFYFRMMSWAGLGGPEAAAGDQGISHEDMSVGASKGQSWIVGLWKFIKSIFWFLVIYAAVWAICSALSLIWPPLGVVASIMAAIATLGLSLISNIVNYFKKKTTETALVQTVAGIDAIKVANPELKPVINTQLGISQDQSSKEVVAAIRN